jgi:transketolase
MKNFKGNPYRNIEGEADLLLESIKIQYFAQQCRIDVFKMLHKQGNGHWGGSSSIAEILSTLYLHFMKTNPENPKNPDRDRLILSKGHAAPMLYNILAKKGFFPVEELSTFRKLNSHLQGHPCMNKTAGVDMSSGPLGHGISVGLGMALAARLQKKDYWTFVIVGDGCLNEGESWEGIMSTAKFKPPRFVIMVDYNKVQLDGPCSEIMPLDPLSDKFRAFNLNVAGKVYDGHNVMEIIKSLEWAKQNQGKPCVIIYKTHKGKGVSFMEDNYKWHGGTIDDKSFSLGIIELSETLLKFKNELS